MFKPARRLLAFLGAALAFTATAPSVQAQPLAGQPKYAAIVVDAKNGEVLYAKRADSPRYPASITKVMTLYLTFEALSSGKLRPDDRVVFSPRAAAQAPTKLGVPAGGSITVSEAMQAMVTKSANDAAVAMAEKLGGTESRFAAMMTLRAKELGMAETHYVNASGLPDSRQLSSARDIALLSRAVMRDYPQYYKLFSQQSFDWHGQKIMNHNRLMLRMPGVDGLKTGFTNASGFNLATSAVRDGRRLIVVVLGGPTTAARDDNAEQLLLTGFDVLNRRARGEKITIAQNFFEPEFTGAISPRVEQGDSEEAGRVELTSVPTPLRASRVEVEPKRKAAGGKWAIQIGAFPKQSDAKKQISLIESRFGKWVDDGRGSTDKSAGKYRSRIQGLTEGDARGACKAIKAKRMACMVVGPA
jgi:D-alanyl-D-alanine carboxypeptidase